MNNGLTSKPHVPAPVSIPVPGPLDRLPVAGHHAGMLIYKIFRAPEWANLRAQGETKGAPVDVADGFVHFSNAAQVHETAAKHFTGEDGLLLLAVEAESLGAALKWEPSRGGALFPHLYRVLKLDDILWAKPLPFTGEQHQFPQGVA